MTVNASEARKSLFPLIRQVNEDRVPVEITSKNGSAVLMAKEDYDSWQETIYLLSSPANAARLLRAVADVREGKKFREVSMEDLDRMVDES